MTRIANRWLKQDAVLWPVITGTDIDADGNQKVSAAIGIKVHWERSVQEAVTSDATPTAISSTVIVDRVVNEGSILWLGSIKTIPGTPTPLLEVVNYSEIPDLKGRRFTRIVTLRAWGRDTLPTIA